MKTVATWCGLVGLLGLVWGAAPALAQVDSREGIALQNEILELRRDVQILRDQVRGGGGSYPPPSRATIAPSAPSASGDLVATLLDRVQTLEDQVRSLRGRLDESENARRQAEADLAKQIGDLSFKIDNGASAGARPAPPPPAPPPIASPPPGNLAPVSPVAPPAGPVKRTPELAMQEGNAALARRDYPAAEAAAREVLAGTRGPRSTDAQFLLAQALAGKRDYAQAAIAFDDTYNRARTGSHAQDALLGLANSLNGINEKRAACETLDKLKVEFPAIRGDLRDGVATARQRAGCK